MPDHHTVDDVLRRSAEVEIPADVEARMRQQFTEFRSRLDRRRHPVRELAVSLFGTTVVPLGRGRRSAGHRCSRSSSSLAARTAAACMRRRYRASRLRDRCSTRWRWPRS